MARGKRRRIRGDECRIVATYQMGDQTMHEVFYAKGRAHITTHPDGRGTIHFVGGRTESGEKINFVVLFNVSRIARYPRRDS